MAADQRDLDQ